MTASEIPSEFDPFLRPCGRAGHQPAKLPANSKLWKEQKPREFIKPASHSAVRHRRPTERLLVGEDPEPPICVGKIERK